MAAVMNGHTNGTNGTNGINGHTEPSYARFSEIPAIIDIPVRGDDGDEAVNLDLTELMDETDELCDLLENENAARTYWVTIALAYAKQNKIDIAIDILQKGLGALAKGTPEDKLAVLACICWLYLLKCRKAPRVKPTQTTDDDKTKEHWLHAATSTLNEASRINPSYPPLFLARGTLYLLRSSLQPSKSTSGGPDHSERTETLKQAAKCFDDAYKHSGKKNLLALFGKAKIHFSMGRYAESLALYQQVLTHAPDMVDPDPRIGIGCCLWALGHKEHARSAWQRSLDVNSERNIPANILLGLSYLDESSQYGTTDPQFAALYKKAMTVHTQTAFKLDAMHAQTCATFGSYFLLRKAWANVERLARRAIEQTDVNAVASDGWYLLARKEHYEGTDLNKAADFYGKADLARGGDEKGYLPAKFGAAQLKTLMGDLDGAKFRLDKIISAPGATAAGAQKSLEAMTLLGILHAEEVYANQAKGQQEDKSLEQKKAIGLLEQVRVAWKDPKRKASPDSAVLLNLAQLYEQDVPERALACLQQVEKMELDEIAEDDDRLPDDVGDEVEERQARRELLSPQLLNNIGCFHYHADRYTQAREDFQMALNSCVKMGDRDGEIDTDALVTSISYNLARTYEAESLTEEAQKIYQGLLDRHPEYTDANARLAYIALNSSSNPARSAETLKALLASDPSNLDLRALYAWHLARTKKRISNLPEDPEQKLYKETLQKYDKHDRYALVGMGNLHLAVAREMRRDTDQDKEKRSKTYLRAVEFFDKVLTLDPRDAFAAQGLGIAMVEDKRDTGAGIQIFSKVRESVKGLSGSVHLNLGHVFAEMKQWSRSIENYELAIARSARERRDGLPEAQILACLGRVWLMRGRMEKKLEAYKTSLELSKQALELSPENINLRFNVAFVQIQLATLLTQLPEAQKTLVDVEEAGIGLDEAIEAFGEIARGPQPPFPRGDLEARANMGKNTIKRQLAQVGEKQAEYERKNASRLDDARRRREEEIRKRETERLRAEAAAKERERAIKEQRDAMAAEHQEDMRRRGDEERKREEAEWTTDAETGERRKRERRPREKRQKRKKKGVEDDEGETDGGVVGGEGTDAEGGMGTGRRARGSRATSGTPGTGSDAEGGGRRRKKKRKLERKGQAGRASASKFKSSEMVEDSDEDGEGAGGTTRDGTPGAAGASGADGGEEDQAVVRSAVGARKKAARVLDEDDDEDGVESAPVAAAAVDGDEE
ncbi:protein required for normal CLN1 and CLN2 G1 cyclin expression [Friedmanniomyces endolithicus]|nr:protein required for normal CLN1 and CLN2 G1 cyclin expression [Friedmanniomyces endolithicus]